VISERIEQSAAATATLAQKLPPNAHIDYVEFKNVTAITFVTGDSMSLGTIADPDAFFEFGSYTVTIDSVATQVLTPETLSRTAASDLVVTSTDDSGDLAGTWAGTLDVVIHFIQYQGIDQSL
jgi:hypothetical protein